jgi:hypothetical protein
MGLQERPISSAEMLLNRAVLEGIETGKIEAVYRRWEQPRVRPGSRGRTPIGVLEVIAVDVVVPGSLTRADAIAAGYETVDQLLESSGSRGETLYRIDLRRVGPDPRVALRDALPDEDEVADLAGRLRRLDRASNHGSWTWQTLALIAENPGVRAADLAASVGREKMPFKLDVRKLKELGLTESLPVGYRLSPRGEFLLQRRP